MQLRNKGKSKHRHIFSISSLTRPPALWLALPAELRVENDGWIIPSIDAAEVFGRIMSLRYYSTSPDPPVTQSNAAWAWWPPSTSQQSQEHKNNSKLSRAGAFETFGA